MSQPKIIHILFKYLVFILIIFCTSLYAQDEVHDNTHHEFFHHKIFIQYGLVFVPEGHDEGHTEDKGKYIAAYGLGYAYRFNHKWSVAAEVNLEGGNYLIKEDIPRENALIIAAVAGYEITPSLGVFLGGGVEIEKHKNYGVLRAGAEYVFHLSDGWALAPLLTFDHKTDYTSWEIAVALSKSF